jgi:hypothetical protein
MSLHGSDVAVEHVVRPEVDQEDGAGRAATR